MNPIVDYVSQISFKFVQPETRLPPGYSHLRNLTQWLGRPADVINTRLPDEGARANSELRELCRIPRMSTIAIAGIIRKIASLMPANQVFLNIGVWNGFTFLAGLAGAPDKGCIGVDNFALFGGPREAFMTRYQRRKGAAHRFYEMDYVDYFAKVHRETIGFYIFDGPHSYEHQRKNLEIAEPFLAPDAIILIDDINQGGASEGTKAFLDSRPGKYEVLFERRTARNGHPTFWNGVTIIRKLH